MWLIFDEGIHLSHTDVNDAAPFTVAKSVHFKIWSLESASLEFSFLMLLII